MQRKNSKEKLTSTNINITEMNKQQINATIGVALGHFVGSEFEIASTLVFTVVFAVALYVFNKFFNDKTK